KPSIALAEDKGVEVQHGAKPVADEEVDAALERMREEQAQFRALDRPAGLGDLLVVDYTLAIEGRDPSSQTGYQFIVGDKTVLPEVDAADAGARGAGPRPGAVRFADN